MSRKCLTTILALLVAAQATMAGALHSHCHDADSGSLNHRSAASNCSHQDAHDHDGQRPAERPSWPVEEDECSICQGLAQFSLLSIDSNELDSESLTEFFATADSQVPCSSPIGVRRARSPPALG